MNEGLRVVSPPDVPVMVFDGECGFCRRWIRRWQEASDDRIEYVPLQEPSLAERFPEIPRAAFAQAVHLIEPEGRVSRGAEAVFRSLAYGQGSERWRRLYETAPAFARASEGLYGWVARHREGVSRLTRWLWGESLERPAHVWVRWLFLRWLGATFFIAFVSLWTQISGLAGSRGIDPASEVMTEYRQAVDARQLGWDRYRLVPTLCWISTDDRFLSGLCGAGAALSLCVMAGVAPAPALGLLWLLYLSLATVCRVFLGFQWDNLLLEAGFLAVWFAPWRWRPQVRRECPPSGVVLWLLRWLLFRLMFASGVVKLSSGDPAWHSLTALTFHYETQPLPTVLGWYAHQLPLWCQKASCAVMFGVELVVPFFIFLPRRLRFVAFWALLGLQVLIALTGNYCFFNLLTVGLCLLLLDDQALLRLAPARWRDRLREQSQVAAQHAREAGRGASWRRWLRRGLLAVLAALILAATTVPLIGSFRAPGAVPRWLIRFHSWLGPLRTFNGYGLFAVMTTTRPELMIEGSDDGQTWRAYAFRYKPGDVNRAPRFVAPHQPRLDWQMWFAALGDARQNPWLVGLGVRLLQGSPAVLALLETNPFPDRPPKYIRAVVYDYHFASPTEHRATGAWWRREYQGVYLQPISLRTDPGG